MTPREEFENLPQIKSILASDDIYYCTLSGNYKTKKDKLLMCVYFLNGAWYTYQFKKSQKYISEVEDVK